MTRIETKVFFPIATFERKLSDVAYALSTHYFRKSTFTNSTRSISLFLKVLFLHTVSC